MKVGKLKNLAILLLIITIYIGGVYIWLYCVKVGSYVQRGATSRFYLLYWKPMTREEYEYISRLLVERLEADGIPAWIGVPIFYIGHCMPFILFSLTFLLILLILTRTVIPHSKLKKLVLATLFIMLYLGGGFWCFYSMMTTVCINLGWGPDTPATMDYWQYIETHVGYEKWFNEQLVRNFEAMGVPAWIGIPLYYIGLFMPFILFILTLIIIHLTSNRNTHKPSPQTMHNMSTEKIHVEEVKGNE